MKLKNLLSLCVLSLTLIANVQAAEVPKVRLNGVESNVSIVKNQGATYIPLRKIADELGATTEWNTLSQTIKIYRGNDMVACKINHKTARINSKIVKMDYPPIVKDGTTYVPLRFVSEAFGATVNLNSTTNVVDVTFKKHTGTNNTSNKGYKASSVNNYGTKFKSPFYNNEYKDVTFLTKADFPILVGEDTLLDCTRSGNMLISKQIMGREGCTVGIAVGFTTNGYLNRDRSNKPITKMDGYDIVPYELISGMDFLYMDSWKDFDPDTIEYITFTYADQVYALKRTEVF